MAKGRRFALGVLGATAIHCGGTGDAGSPGDNSARDASPSPDASANADADGTSPRPDGSPGADASSPPPDADTLDAPTGGPALAIGEWTDAPGACPNGTARIDITTPSQLASAARGDSPYDRDPPATCYFIHDGTYTTTGVVLYILKGGIPGGTRAASPAGPRARSWARAARASSSTDAATSRTA